jgi:hypothetical protein
MTYVLFVGDMLVMAFMAILVVWVSLGVSDEQIDATANIPLEDEDSDGRDR